jgi:hypothetical protein
MVPDPNPPVATWGMFRWVGVIVCAIAWIIVTYELLGLLTPLPTLSRLTQGLRDDGHKVLVFSFSIMCGLVFMVLAQWLYYHFNYQPRSGN